MQAPKQILGFTLAALWLSFLAVGVAHAAPPPPPPPPPHPSQISPPVDICAERSSLLVERDYLFEVRPCTIVAGPKGRKLEVASTTGPAPFKHANAKQYRPTKVVFRAFVPVAREANGTVRILATGRVLGVRLPNRLPSVLKPYNITLPPGICREHGWLVSAAISDGTETKMFGVINSICGPAATTPVK